MEALHSAGYLGALAHSLIASESTLSRLEGSILEDFVAENYTAPRMVLTTSGVHHEELTEIAKPIIEDLSGVKVPQEPKSVYVGGEYRQQAASEVMGHPEVFPRTDMRHFQGQTAGIFMRNYFRRPTV